MQNTKKIEKIEQDKRLKQNMLRIKYKLVVMSGGFLSSVRILLRSLTYCLL